MIGTTARTVLCVGLIGCLGILNIARAQEREENVVGALSGYWTFPHPKHHEPLYNIDQRFSLSNDPAPGPMEPWLSYMTHFGILAHDGRFNTAGYIGIQKDQISKRAVFRIRNANAASCAPVADAVCRPFDTGTGGDPWVPRSSSYQTTIPYEWVAGHNYRTRIWADRSDENGDWWVGAIMDETTRVEQVIGYIRVPLFHEGLDYWLVNWVEYVEPVGHPPELMCEELVPSTVSFALPHANNGTVVSDGGVGSCPSTIQK